MRSLGVLVVLALGLVVAPGGPPGGPAAASPGAGPGATPVFPTPIRHVVVIVLENANRSDVLQRGPFERYLAQEYPSPPNDYAVCHPSAPNYLALTGGAPRQCGSDAWKVYNATNLGDLLDAAGKSWSGFAESMPSACGTTDAYPYAVKHNPFVYYQDIEKNSSRCRAHDQNFSAWTADVANASLPDFALISPNLRDDGHDTGVAYADSWLKGFLSPLLNDSFANQTAFFVTYDEAEGTNSSTGYNGTAGGPVYLTAVSRYSRGVSAPTLNESHYDLLTTVEWLLGLGGCGTNDSSAFPPMTGLFHFPITNYTLGGTVVANATGLPIPGANVSVVAGPSTTTDLTGAFQFTLPNGSYTVRARAEGFQWAGANVSIAGGPASIDFSLLPTSPATYPVEVHVTSTSTGADLPGAEVTVGPSATPTNATGRVELQLANGSYAANVTAPGWGPASANFTVAGAPVRMQVALVPVPPATFPVFGNVTNASSGRPVAGATVSLNNASWTTDASGRFQLSLPNGSYLVSVAAAGYRNGTGTAVVDGGPDHLDLRLSPFWNGSSPPGGGPGGNHSGPGGGGGGGPNGSPTGAASSPPVGLPGGTWVWLLGGAAVAGVAAGWTLRKVRRGAR